MGKVTNREFDVYLNDQKIDTVFWVIDVTPEEVKQSLIDHNGYNPSIIVKAC